MPKFDLKKLKKEAASRSDSAETITIDGYTQVKITQVAELGMQRGFNKDDPDRFEIGFVFTTPDGISIAKEVNGEAYSTRSHLSLIDSAIDGADDLEDMLGKELVIEVQANGRYPKIISFAGIDDGLVDELQEFGDCELIYFQEDDHDPAVLKTKLHPQLRRKFTTRIRRKGDRS